MLKTFKIHNLGTFKKNNQKKPHKPHTHTLYQLLGLSESAVRILTKVIKALKYDEFSPQIMGDKVSLTQRRSRSA